MKTSFALLVLGLSLLAQPARAQTPTVQVYLDSQFHVVHRTCPPGGTVDTLYVVASGFSSPITDIEYSINTWGNFGIVQDLVRPGFSGTGFSGIGIHVDFGGPANASGNLLVQRILGFWDCKPCGGGGWVTFIVVEPHNESGKIQATKWPDLTKVEALGGVNSLCGVLPTQPTTWGRIKALYR